MSKFRIGDVVQVVSWPERDREKHILGLVGTVIDTDCYVRVRFPENVLDKLNLGDFQDNILFDDDEIELVSDGVVKKFFISCVVEASSIQEALNRFNERRGVTVTNISSIAD